MNIQLLPPLSLEFEQFQQDLLAKVAHVFTLPYGEFVADMRRVERSARANVESTINDVFKRWCDE